MENFNRNITKCCACLLLGITLGASAPAFAEDASESAERTAVPNAETAQAPVHNGGKNALDRSGKPRRGKASFYHRKFAGRKMADGTPMNPEADIAASRTLPLGTKAKVTNLENGKSSVVEIRDRGPYVDGRIVDLSPKVARKLDMQEQGVVPVEVRPIELPQPKTADKAAETQSAQAEQARD